MPEPRPERVAYLPPKAAKARKLILRTQLGRGWIVASALFGVVILAAGALYLATAGRPGAPWIRVAPLGALAAGAVTQTPAPGGRVVVVDRRNDELRAFLVPSGRCPVVADGAGFARPCAGQHWNADGTPAAGRRVGPQAPPLRQVPVALDRGDLYVDRSCFISVCP